MKFIKNTLFNLEYYDETLPSGLKIRFIKKKGFIKKSVYLSVGFGSNYRKFKYMGKTYKIKEGIAHAIEHKIYENEDGSDAFKELSIMGVDANAFTTTNFTCYHFKTTSDVLKPLLKTFDFLLHPYFNEQSLKREIPIILNELSRKKEDPYYDYELKITSTLYPNTSRRDSVLGSKSAIKSFTISDLYESYEAFYKLSNMRLVVVGDMDFSLILNEIKRYLSPYKYTPYGEIIMDDYGYQSQNIRINNRNVIIPKSTLAFRVEDTSIKSYFIYLALFYYMYSSSGENRLKMVDSGLINTSLDATMYHEEGMLYGAISIEDRYAFKMINNILANLDSFNIYNMNEMDLKLFKRYYLGGIYSLSNNIDELAETTVVKMVLDEELFDTPNIINSISLDDVYYAFLDFKKAKKIIISLYK